MADSRLVLVAERHNPKRAFLLVSTVLGKHLPVSAARCRLSGLALGLAVAEDRRAGEARRALLGGDELWVRQLVADIEAAPAGPDPYVVVGFAETATALGEQVATALDAVHWQTTTRQASIAARGLPFAEPHSHAPEQWIARPEGGWPDGTLVLVDDELTTGRTACNLIEVLHAEHPRERYVIAALLDGRGSSKGEAESPIEALATRLGVTIDVVALGTRPAERRTEAGWSGGILPAHRSDLPAARVRDIAIGFTGALQHDGQDRDARLGLAGATVCAASELGDLPPGTLMLGTGEHLAFAQRTAVFSGSLTSSSTRSPVLVSDQPDYPIRDGLAFPNSDDLAVPGFAYNVLASERPAIVVHFQDGAHRERGQAFLDLLAADGARDLIAVTLAP
ncbi:MAG: phosphoribosyltransferase domain-containing protein [Solirubrobacteraceae bacterium]|nr:phosphoribosyltransferase domain-containing protein [Solirubrobacteraceae bacterium]